MTPTNILVLGAGELGTSILHSLANHQSTRQKTITVLLRQTSITPASNKEQESKIQSLRILGIQFLPADLVNDSIPSLSEAFRPYDTIISCIGFTAGSGTQVKISKAVLEAGAASGPTGRKRRFIPWQFGVDYDAIGRGSPHDLFDEQLDVRDLLRGQEQVEWVIVSTGMFMSFVFHEGFGVVDLREGVVRALGGWENRVTVMAVEDIGKVTSQIVLGEDTERLFERSGPVFVAGDTVSYGELAGFLEKFTGREFRKEVVTVEQAIEGARSDDAAGVSSALNKYRAVFGQGKGVAWDLKDTWNHRAGIPVMSLEEWARKNLREYMAAK